MSKADVVTFNLQYESWLADRKIKGRPGVGDKDFAYFCAEQFLKDRCLSDKEIESGLVDRSDDGGVDSFYCFYNNTLLDDTERDIDARADGTFHIKIIQSRFKGFSPTTIEKIERFIDDLLSFDRPEAEYIYQYHEGLCALVRNFKELFNHLKKRSTPTINIEVAVMSRMDVDTPGRNALMAALKLVEKAKQYYTNTVVEDVRFIGLTQLWSLFREAEPAKKSVALAEKFNTEDGWVALVKLKDYFEFLKDDNASKNRYTTLDEHIFDSNVRGYQIGSRVNARITHTLEVGTGEFWQLNNGITILSPEATLSGALLTIKNPQIVNGLQTSRRIFEYFRTNPPLPENDKRLLLIRVIKTNDETTRSEIIRATNDQNTMPAEAFLSTMRIQHQIEDYFGRNGLFYERRKGHYKAQYKPTDQIVEVLELMQALIAIVRREPETSRGGPRAYLKEGKRELLFGSDDTEGSKPIEPFPLDVYLRCVQIMRRVEEYLTAEELRRPVIKNLQAYVALDATTSVLKHARFKPELVATIGVDKDLTDTVLGTSYKRVNRAYDKFGANDTAAKSKRMADYLRQRLKDLYGVKKKKT